MVGQAPGQLYLVGCTRLDPMSYMLFGAHSITVEERGLECDDWLPIVGNIDALDNIQRLKTYLEGCLLRVFEGVYYQGRRSSRNTVVARRAKDIEEEHESDDEDDREVTNPNLSSAEMKDLDFITQNVVRILNRYADERHEIQSRRNSRPATPMGSPALGSLRLPGPSSGRRSGTATPYYHPYDSRPATPSRLR